MPSASLLLLASTLQRTPLVHGGPRAPAGWAALVRGQAWVCWREGPDCWRPVPMELAEIDPAPALLDDEDLDDDARVDHDADLDAYLDDDAYVDPEDLMEDDDTPARGSGAVELRRLGFLDPDRLAVVDADGRAWTVARTDPFPRAVDAGEVIDVEVPRVLPCSPTGWLPVREPAGWRWVAAACTPGAACARGVVRMPRIRAPGITLAVGFSLAVGRSRARTQTLLTSTTQGTADLQLLLVASLGFDPRAAVAYLWQWRSLRDASRREVRLPPVASGPLAREELRALRGALCSGDSSWLPLILLVILGFVPPPEGPTLAPADLGTEGSQTDGPAPNAFIGVPGAGVVREALARLPTSPTLEQVQRAALARGQLDASDARRWLRRARAAALLPSVSTGYDLRLDRGWSLDQEPGVADALQNDLGHVSTVRLRATWELDRALFNPDELRAVRSALDLADWRERVLIDVTRLYFERMRLLIERDLASGVDVASAIEREVRLREVEGVLEGLTGIRGVWTSDAERK